MSANVSQDEVDKFNTFAAQWWDPDGPMKPLHVLNPLRLEYIKKHAPVAGSTLIDVGCGAGLLSEALAIENAHVSAIDMSDDVLKVAAEHAKNNDISVCYNKITAEKEADENPQKYDIVTCMEMLEHVPDPSAIVNACAIMAKPGATLFFSTINRSVRGYLKAVVGAEYILGLLPKGTHDYGKFIKPSELDNWARQAGLVLVDLSGVSYNPLRESCKLTSNVSVNYLCCYKKP